MTLEPLAISDRVWLVSRESALSVHHGFRNVSSILPIVLVPDHHRRTGRLL